MSIYKAEDSGLLLVFSDPGNDAGLEEFHDWYDNEHVPLRTERFTTFRSAARYEVTSSLSSTEQPFAQARWAASYTISSNQLYNEQAYTSLREHRSPREAELLGRVAVLDRRIYRLVYDSAAGGSVQPGSEAARVSNKVQSAEEVRKGAPFLVANSVTPSDKEAYDRWYEEEHVGLLKKVPGWNRTRRFELVDAVITGRNTEKADAAKVPTCLGLHEYTNPDFESTDEFRAAVDTPWRREVMGEKGEKMEARERRVMKLYRSWDPERALQEEKEEKEQQTAEQ